MHNDEKHDHVRPSINMEAESRDAERYRFLRAVGAAPLGTRALDEGLVLAEAGLDAWVDSMRRNSPPAPAVQIAHPVNDLPRQQYLISYVIQLPPGGVVPSIFTKYNHVYVRLPKNLTAQHLQDFRNETLKGHEGTDTAATLTILSVTPLVG